MVQGDVSKVKDLDRLALLVPTRDGIVQAAHEVHGVVLHQDCDLGLKGVDHNDFVGSAQLDVEVALSVLELADEGLVRGPWREPLVVGEADEACGGFCVLDVYHCKFVQDDLVVDSIVEDGIDSVRDLVFLDVPHELEAHLLLVCEHVDEQGAFEGQCELGFRTSYIYVDVYVARHVALRALAVRKDDQRQEVELRHERMQDDLVSEHRCCLEFDSEGLAVYFDSSDDCRLADPVVDPDVVAVADVVRSDDSEVDVVFLEDFVKVLPVEAVGQDHGLQNRRVAIRQSLLVVDHDFGFVDQSVAASDGAMAACLPCVEDFCYGSLLARFDLPVVNRTEVVEPHIFGFFVVVEPILVLRRKLP